MWANVNRGRLMALNENNMSGNSDWEQAETSLGVNDRLSDDHGAALYKVVNGQTMERTQEEREADWPPEPVPVPTIEERFAFLEDCLMEMSEEVYK